MLPFGLSYPHHYFANTEANSATCTVLTFRNSAICQQRFYVSFDCHNKWPSLASTSTTCWSCENAMNLWSCGMILKSCLNLRGIFAVKWLSDTQINGDMHQKKNAQLQAVNRTEHCLHVLYRSDWIHTLFCLTTETGSLSETSCFYNNGQRTIVVMWYSNNSSVQFSSVQLSSLLAQWPIIKLTTITKTTTHKQL